jgi:hypothetical protein
MNYLVHHSGKGGADAVNEKSYMADRLNLVEASSLPVRHALEDVIAPKCAFVLLSHHLSVVVTRLLEACESAAASALTFQSISTGNERDCHRA